VDNDFTDSDDDFNLDCIGTPYVGTDPSPVAMDDADWLEDLEDWSDPEGCDSTTLEYNRSTIYDAMKFFWVLTSDPSTPMSPSRLSDLYVDRCPRSWSETDYDWVYNGSANAPWGRVQDAAAEQPSYEDQVLDALVDYLVHY
jgi:hypothetical protein